MWIAYALLCAISYGICDFSTKYATPDGDTLAMYKIIVPTGISFALFAIFRAATGNYGPSSFASLLMMHPPVLLITAGYLVAMLFYNAAYRFMEGAVATALEETTFFFTFVILAAYYLVTGKTAELSEAGSFVRFIAAAGIFLGIILLAVFQHKRATVAQNSESQAHPRFGAKFLLIPLFAAFLDAFISMGDSLMLDSYAGVGVNEDDYLFLTGVLYAFFLGVVPYIILCIKLRHAYNPFAKENLRALIPGVSETVGLLLYMKAVAAEPFYAFPLISISPVFGVFFCRILLKERIGFKRWATVSLIIACSVILAVSMGEV